MGFSEDETTNLEGSFYGETSVLLERLALNFPDLHLSARALLHLRRHARSLGAERAHRLGEGCERAQVGHRVG
eukprot:EC712836.1.p2 GENE.EC712836.1~~EC712836.1.p2  ORF type:complete len:73 (+),score=10.93 EC712836.1:69-287(+)